MATATGTIISGRINGNDRDAVRGTLKGLMAAPTAPARGAPKGRAKGAGKRPAKVTRVESLAGIRKGISIALGVAIPGMSLTLSHIAGTLACETPFLAGLVGTCGLAVLAVSLSHLAEALADATGSAKWQAWSLAVAIDLSIAACELCHVFSTNESLWPWCTGLMVVMGLISVALNVYAFLKHAR